MSEPMQIDPATNDQDQGPGESRMPLSRVKRIIKQDRDIQSVSSTAVYSVSAATKLFVSYLAEQALMSARSDGKQRINYDDVANAVDKNELLEFLGSVIPRRTKYSVIAQERAAANMEEQGALVETVQDDLESPKDAGGQKSDSSMSP